jgi:hypothetical protein
MARAFVAAPSTPTLGTGPRYHAPGKSRQETALLIVAPVSGENDKARAGCGHKELEYYIKYSLIQYSENPDYMQNQRAPSHRARKDPEG